MWLETCSSRCFCHCIDVEHLVVSLSNYFLKAPQHLFWLLSSTGCRASSLRFHLIAVFHCTWTLKRRETQRCSSWKTLETSFGKMMVVWSLVSVGSFSIESFNSCKQIRSTNRSSPVHSPTSQPQLNTLQVDLELLSRKALFAMLNRWVLCLWSAETLKTFVHLNELLMKYKFKIVQNGWTLIMIQESNSLGKDDLIFQDLCMRIANKVRSA